MYPQRSNLSSEHLSNALSTIFVTLVGIVAFSNTLQSKNAYSPIPVMPSSTTISFTLCLCSSHGQSMDEKSGIAPVPPTVSVPVLSSKNHTRFSNSFPAASISSVVVTPQTVQVRSISPGVVKVGALITSPSSQLCSQGAAALRRLSFAYL